MTPDITALVRHPLLWRGKQAAHHVATLASGHAALDRALPGHGWPLGAITELIHDTPGCGELSLVLPALARLHQTKSGQTKSGQTKSGQTKSGQTKSGQTRSGQAKHRIILLDPPWIPYPPALHEYGLALDRVLLIRTQNSSESLWACEQVLRGMPGGAVLAWPKNISFSELRRLQLAAEKGQKVVFLFRHANAANSSSPAALRLQLTADDGDLQVRVLKCRGQRTTAVIRIRRQNWDQPLIPPRVSSSGSSKRSSSSSESPVVSLATSRIGRPSL